MADDAPDSVALHSSILGFLLVSIQLVVGKNLECETGAEDEDSQIVGPFHRGRQGGLSAGFSSQRMLLAVSLAGDGIPSVRVAER